MGGGAKTAPEPVLRNQPTLEWRHMISEVADRIEKAMPRQQLGDKRRYVWGIFEQLLSLLDLAPEDPEDACEWSKDLTLESLAQESLGPLTVGCPFDSPTNPPPRQEWLARRLMALNPATPMVEQLGFCLVRWASDARSPVDLWFFLGLHLAFLTTGGWVPELLCRADKRGVLVEYLYDLAPDDEPGWSNLSRFEDAVLRSAEDALAALSLQSRIPRFGKGGSVPDWAGGAHDILMEEFSRVDDAAGSGADTCTAVGHARAAKGGGLPVGDARPPRLWTQTRCPNCGHDAIEFIGFREFSKRCRSQQCGVKIHRDTVSKRVREGKYLANADKKVPWCPNCKHLTPQGDDHAKRTGGGLREQLDQRPDPSVDQMCEATEEDQRWAAEVTQERYAEFNYLSYNPDSRTDDPAHERFSIALLAICQERNKSEGDLTEKRAKEVARAEIEKQKTADYKGIHLDSMDKIDPKDVGKRS